MSTFYKPDTSLRQTAEAGHDCVLLRESWLYCPIFKTLQVANKYLMDNKHNNLRLVWKYAPIFVYGHSLFLKAHSFPRASLSESCSFLGTDIDGARISEHIFVPSYCLYIKSLTWHDYNIIGHLAKIGHGKCLIILHLLSVCFSNILGLFDLGMYILVVYLLRKFEPWYN